jgi:hypothetical protein
MMQNVGVTESTLQIPLPIAPTIGVFCTIKDGGKDYNEFEYPKPLVTKQVHAKLMWPL